MGIQSGFCTPQGWEGMQRDLLQHSWDPSSLCHIPSPAMGPGSVTGAVTEPAQPSQALSPPLALSLCGASPCGQGVAQLEVAPHPPWGTWGRRAEVSPRLCSVLGEPHSGLSVPSVTHQPSTTQQPGDTTQGREQECGQRSSRVKPRGDVSSSQMSRGHLKLWQEVALGHHEGSAPPRRVLAAQTLQLPGAGLGGSRRPFLLPLKPPEPRAEGGAGVAAWPGCAGGLSGAGAHPGGSAAGWGTAP